MLNNDMHHLELPFKSRAVNRIFSSFLPTYWLCRVKQKQLSVTVISVHKINSNCFTYMSDYITGYQLKFFL